MTDDDERWERFLAAALRERRDGDDATRIVAAPAGAWSADETATHYWTDYYRRCNCRYARAWFALFSKASR